MSNIMTIKDVRGYLDENGTAHLNLEDVARGLGFTEIKHDKEYIRWRTVEGYLKEFDFSQPVAKGNFIPENIFYKLCFKANNEVARNFQNIVCDEILPTIRKTGTYSTLPYQKKSTSVGEVTNLIKVLRGIMKDEDHLPEDIATMAQIVCNQFNILVPNNFVKKSPYQQLFLTINLEQH